MAPTPAVVRLPNGQTLTVAPVFGGYFFRFNDLNIHSNTFPPGWTVILQSEDYSDEHLTEEDGADHAELSGMPNQRRHHIHPYRTPTLHNDNLFISSISSPSNSDYKPPTSPTRAIAMMLWASLYWYFHQQEPSPYLTTEASKNTPDEGKPKGEWRINIKREGVFRGRNLVQKLERMGLISSEDSTVGTSLEEHGPEGWSEMFTSRRNFWQMPATLFLFTLSPSQMSHASPPSPYGSRPSSPVRGEVNRNHSPSKRDSLEAGQILSPGLWSPSSSGPFSSGSHLPTYFPPTPLQYTMSKGTRHPIRSKPPRQGETFYTRYVPSVGQYLSFRTASLSDRPVAFNGPTFTTGTYNSHRASTSLSSIPSHLSATSLSENPPSPLLGALESSETRQMTDLQLLHKWMNNPRVSKFWGCAGPQEVQTEFLTTNLKSKHSFPVIGLWDGQPFGYFELYWVKEDGLGKYLGGDAGDYDRGFHVLVGEEEFRGKARVQAWITSLAHWAFCVDYRTNNVVLEPRVDNER
ncbi:hypothetical protein PVAG01_00193 [Phlyctema vagabunda]|uniref:Acyltransferase MbtK/IucB-like conserved domain-containing protein n=1 Tax=Phlyctema vagabunda TaxID=108571 RepID=A0ABR4PTU1_9HELO